MKQGRRTGTVEFLSGGAFAYANRESEARQPPYVSTLE